MSEPATGYAGIEPGWTLTDHAEALAAERTKVCKLVSLVRSLKSDLSCARLVLTECDCRQETESTRVLVEVFDETLARTVEGVAL